MYAEKKAGDKNEFFHEDRLTLVKVFRNAWLNKKMSMNFSLAQILSANWVIKFVGNKNNEGCNQSFKLKLQQ